MGRVGRSGLVRLINQIDVDLGEIDEILERTIRGSVGSRHLR